MSEHFKNTIGVAIASAASCRVNQRTLIALTPETCKGQLLRESDGLVVDEAGRIFPPAWKPEDEPESERVSRELHEEIRRIREHAQQTSEG